MGSIAKLSRNSFPDGFLTRYNIASRTVVEERTASIVLICSLFEGETNKSGKGPNIWDTFIEEHPERISDHSNANVAVDFYHRYKAHVQRMKGMGMDAFRFSISWSRVLPHGRLSAGINEEGIQFYNNLIDELIKNGIQPFATLFHWDTPQAIEDKYGGFLSRNILNDFQDFVELCFQKFGDRVKHWITLNEPFMFSVNGYDTGTMAPGRVSTLENYPGQPKISGATEVYIVTHHLLLAHATAVKVYKEKYQTCQGGKIGITLVSHWFEPYSSSESDRMATKRSLEFMLGYMDPVTKGDYPQTMHDYVGGRLPKFSEEESKMLRGSYDFIGVNYYTTYYAQNVEDANYKNIGFMEDARVNWPANYIMNHFFPLGIEMYSRSNLQAGSSIRHLLNYIKDAYENPTIYITENGVDDVKSSSLEEALNDPVREQYYKDIFDNVLKSINEHGVDVKGFFAWSFSDDFEWGSGYGSRFGLYFIDYENDLKRYAKNSVKWFKQFLHKDEIKLNHNMSHIRVIKTYLKPNGSHKLYYRYLESFLSQSNLQAGSSIRHLLNYIKDTYENPTIYITENGVDDVNSSSLEEALNDHVREQNYKDIFDNVLKSINDHGVDVKGFFAWSFSDDFEWGYGYSSRFGLFFIDYENDLKRYAKNSVKWFKQFLHKDETKLNHNIKSISPPRMVEGSERSSKKSRIE
ncbi:hypothetical protein SADUNF_Sadunf16G0118300 [Salix dunnii]|uniref:Beta-glucosidase n=1 Tax=Salix dunnii TaxID=1413687 RepID=A0A835J992_9ROSI|nr:hypothetical protein SADUNF_Sadunf16G0118300 [Salix dunnii]